ncbi:MAG: preprotein translocase subunit SecA [Lentisphaerae bacterium]|nr:preprotein translocase subunit SecA [Lentisphaerota bacterium]
MLTALLKLIFGTKSQRDVRRMVPMVAKINRIEEELQKLSDEELQAKTAEFKQRLADGATVDSLMCEAFAVVKNACRRLCGQTVMVCGQPMTWNMIPFDVQIMGGIALHRGGIAEMATGEGKTLVATMPLYLNALTGRNCQLVTVNDYLARRDSDWMGAIYKFLGLTVGCLQNMMSPDERRQQYACDITYGTNSEFGFDYLRDMGMATDVEQLVQRDHFYAIVDEIDSILIDEARTPLIISGPVPMSNQEQFKEIRPLVGDVYSKQNLLCSRLIREARETLAKGVKGDEREAALTKLLQVKFGMPTHKQLLHVLEDGDLLKELEKLEAFVRSDNNRGMIQEVQSELYFTIDEKTHEADLTERGRNAVAPNNPDAFILPDLLQGIHNIENDESLSEEKRVEVKQKFQDEYAAKSERLHNLSQLLKAYCLFEKDVHYVVQEGKVMIVDEHTGRLMPGRRFSDGLHQALEAKENVAIEKETQTMATITIQNYFRMYDKLSGMTGTAETEANEFHQIYKLDVTVIPTNKPCIRKDSNDSIFKTKREKFNAIVEDVEERHKAGQPVLLGTISVEDSEILSRMLKRKNLPHHVLNAKNHQYEAEIVAMAGQRGAITVATNMAGRGTDIKLGEGVTELGGLHVIGSSRHDSRRIDRQLRGRCSRQGDPGSSKFYVSLEDNLMRLFGSDRIVKIFERFGIEEGEELQHPFLNRSIETAQRRVEQQHFSIRKRTLEFDDVMNKQREIIYGLRKETLFSDHPGDVLMKIVEDMILDEIELAATPSEKAAKNDDGNFNWERLLYMLNSTFPLEFKREELTAGITKNEVTDPEALTIQIADRIGEAYKVRNAHLAEEQLVWLERHTVLDAIDQLWQEHLYTMDQLRSSIYLRTYAQKDPLVEYKNEAFTIFEMMMRSVRKHVAESMFRATITTLSDLEDMFSSLPQSFSGGDLPPELLAALQAQAFTVSGGVDSEASFSVAAPPQEEAPRVVLQPAVRTAPKVGANDPCPCGSGKKYKKCCGK